jgi:hypothetical protein
MAQAYSHSAKEFSTMQPDLILVPFAQDAPAVNVDAIPVSLGPSDPPQAASWSQGFPTVTMTPLAAGGIPPRGQSFNGVLQDITQHLVYIGGGGQYKWSQAYVTAKGGYAIGDVIQSDDGLLAYVSIVNNNTQNFNTTPASIGPSWRLWAGGQVPAATTATPGIARIATQVEVDNSNGTNTIVTPATLGQKFTTYFVQATETVMGVLRIATAAQVTAGTDDTRAITPLKLAQRLASAIVAATTTVAGIARIATQTEVDNSTGANLIVTPATLGQKFTDYFKQATESVIGVLRISTTAQVTAGTDDATAITPLKLAQRLAAVVVSATTSVAGISRIATQTEVNNSSANNLVVTPATLGVLLTNYVVQATTLVAGIARTATQALVNAGTDTQTIVTPATLRFGVSYSLSINGYIVLPSWLGGIAFQWGSVATAGTVTFPTAFTAAYIAIASSNINGNFTSTSALTTTSVLLSNSGNQPMTWFALGRV